MQKLTKKQRKLYEFIKNNRRDLPPTYKQMREYMEVKSDNAVFRHLKTLTRKGYL